MFYVYYKLIEIYAKKPEIQTDLPTITKDKLTCYLSNKICCNNT